MPSYLKPHTKFVLVMTDHARVDSSKYLNVDLLHDLSNQIESHEGDRRSATGFLDQKDPVREISADGKSRRNIVEMPYRETLITKVCTTKKLEIIE